MEPPDTTQCEWVTPPHPLSFKHLEGAWCRQPVPVIGNIEQVSTRRATRKHFIYGKRRTARRGDTLLECEIGAGGNSQNYRLQMKGLIRMPYLLYSRLFGASDSTSADCSKRISNKLRPSQQLTEFPPYRTLDRKMSVFKEHSLPEDETPASNHS